MAIYRKDVYCEFEFLKKFRSSNGHFSPFDSDALRVWLNVADFIQNSHIKLDIDAQIFKKSIKRGDTLFSLWKKATEGTCKITFLDDHKKKFFENLIVTPEGLNTAYLLAKHNAICKDFAEKYGVIILSPTCWQSNEQAKKVQYIFRDCGSKIKKNEVFNWNDILRNEYNLSYCNAAILIDNYIHQNIKENLLQIVECILPKSLRNSTFHLTILTAKNVGVSYEHIYNELIYNIKSIRPLLHCDVELYVKNGKDDFHDRCILTNNTKIGSEAGFSLRNSNGKSKNATDIHILHPGLQRCSDPCDKSYVDYLEDAKRFISKIENGYCTGERFPKGRECKNRLIVG